MNKHFWFCAAIIGATATWLAAEETATVNRARVNVRGQPSLSSEVITQLHKGDQVTYLEEVPVEKPKPGEPASWAAIKMPPNTPVWVFTSFLNGKTVKVPKLNLRAGPGENFSVVGRLVKGDEVKEIRTIEEWMQIETPDSAKAYLDASYLDRTNSAPVAVAAAPVAEPVKVYEPPTKQEPTPTPAPPKAEPVKEVAAKPAPPPVTETKITEEPAPAKPVDKPKEEKKPADKPAKPEENKPAPAPPPVAPVETPKPAATTPVEAAPEPTRVLPEVAKPLPTVTTNIVMMKRLVRREGEVRSTKFNIQAPTYFELHSAQNGKIINYLNGEKNGLKLKDYKGLRVIVTGEEGIEPRFPDRPVLEVETIEVAP